MVSGRDFIRVAKRMERISRNLSEREREALLRRAVSTVYYGVLWEAIEFLESKGARINRDYKVHQTVRMSLKAKGYDDIHTWLIKLHRLRKKADYNLDDIITRKDFNLAMTFAKLILKEVGI